MARILHGDLALALLLVARVVALGCKLIRHVLLVHFFGLTLLGMLAFFVVLCRKRLLRLRLLDHIRTAALLLGGECLVKVGEIGAVCGVGEALVGLLALLCR